MKQRKNRTGQYVLSVKMEEVAVIQFQDESGRPSVTQRLFLHTECANAADRGVVHRSMKKVIHVFSQQVIDSGLLNGAST